MTKYINDPFYSGWPVYQIAAHTLIHNKLSISINTWYKYIKVMGIVRNVIKKNNQQIGIRASEPDKIWHMDVTIYKTPAGQRVHIYLLLDNFSRFILAYKTALFLSGTICLNMIREAYYRFLKPVKKSETMLLCDGGPENNNSHLDSFLEQPAIPIRKIIAQKDIHFSNSLIEAFNRTLKYKYLFRADIPDFDSLNKHLAKFIPEYNTVRPHYAHKYLTPAQVYFGKGINLDKIKKQMERARKMRIIENKKADCPLCK